ncbi:hypothetical protein MKEN_00234700 [Mycena kentingensis (nom. inval.)]|nr:hypothetical protein MKEN_00234700 [Mycena kentingensis (nom. inval.)]
MFFKFKLPALFVLLSCSSLVLAGGKCAVCADMIVEKEYHPTRNVTFELVDTYVGKKTKTVLCPYYQKYVKEEERQKGFCAYDVSPLFVYRDCS